MSQGLYSGASGLALGTGLYRNTSGLWGGSSGLIDGFDGSGGPALSLDFINQSYVMNNAGYQFQDLIRFSRTTAGTFVGSDGFIQNSPVSKNLLVWTQEFNNAMWTKVAASVQSNLLLRSQEYDNASWIKNTSFIQTNLLTYSEQFDNTAWVKTRATVTANATTNPNGESTADKIVEDTSTNSHFISQTIASVAANTTFSVSIFAKAAGRDFLALVTQDSGGTFRTSYFNLSTGTIGTVAAGHTASIFPAGNGWYRCVIATSQAATTGAFSVYPSPANVDGSVSYTGDGTSGIFVWGAQLTQGTAPGDYQRTEATALAVGYTAPDGTTSADKLVVDNAAPFSSSYIRQNISKAAAAITYTTSVYAKAGEFNRIRLFVRENAAGANSAFVTVSLVDGSIVSAANAIGTFTNASATVTDAGDGWYRIALTFTTGTETNIWGQTVFAEDSVATTGNGASGIYIWGSQLATGVAVGDYAPTTSTTVALQYTAPNGLPCADKIVEDTTASTTHYAFQSSSYTLGTAYTVSVYAKAGERNWFAFQIPSTLMGTIRNAFFDVSNGTVGTVTSGITAAISPVGNGWYRCSVTFTPTASVSASIAYLLADADNSISYTGNGSSGLYIWGAQLEVVPDANLVLGSELLGNGAVGIIGTATAATYNTSTGVGTASRTNITNQSFVQWTGLTNTSTYRFNITNTGAANVNVRSGSQGSSVILTLTPGQSALFYGSPSSGLITITAGADGATASFTVNSIKEFIGTTGMPTSYSRNADGLYPPRFDYDPVTLAPKGILIEEQRANVALYSAEFDNAAWNKSNTFVQTNLFTYSQQFDNAAWIKGNVAITANTTTAPDGTLTGDTITGLVAGATNNLRESITAAATQYTFSIWVRAGTATTCALLLRDNTALQNLAVTSSILSGPGSVSGSTAVTVSGLSSTEWTRVAITTNIAVIGGTDLIAYFYPETATSANTTAKSNVIWGAQLVQGTAPGDYQETLGSPLAVQYFAPDGASSAEKIVEDTTASVSHAVNCSTITFAATTTYTMSVYAKKGERDWLYIQPFTTPFGVTTRCYFDLSTGTIGAAANCTPSITPAGNGWYRCSITATTTVGGAASVVFAITTGNSVITYTGDGTSGIYLWGAQVEVGAFVTSYMPTVGLMYVRAPDITLVTGGAFTPWYNPLEGTLSAEVIPETVNLFNQFLATISDGTTSNRAGMFKSTASLLGARITVNGIATNPGSPAFPFPAGAVSKAAFAFSTGTNNLSGALNGTLGTAATLAAMPSNQNTLCIGVNESATANWSNGRVRSIRYYSTRLTNAQLQELTA